MPKQNIQAAEVFLSIRSQFESRIFKSLGAMMKFTDVWDKVVGESHSLPSVPENMQEGEWSL